MNINLLLKKAMEQNASDLHLVANLPPTLRVSGEIRTMDGFDKISPERTKALIYGLLNDEQKTAFERDWRLSFSTLIEGHAHIRVSVYYHLGQVEAAIRIRSMEVPTLEQLGHSSAVAELTRKPNGLVLITGPTGVGKTTTLYAMIDLINRERRCKIITVEDPIEYVHPPKRSIIVQQELGRDAKTFAEALFHILRLDPDVIVIGEMRDMETISTALVAAETGHLVIGTLHTNNASLTVSRIINAFPAHERSLIANQLASTIQGIVSQVLLPTVDRKKRVLAYEIMLGNDAVRNLIREGKIQNLDNVIMTGKEIGMQTLDMMLKELYQKAEITADSALLHAKNPKFILGEQ